MLAHDLNRVVTNPCPTMPVVVQGFFIGEIMLGKREDLTGLRFGRLEVVEYNGLANGKTCWLVRCDCGSEKIVRSDHIKSGATKSCGCLSKEITIKRSTTHGMSNTSIHDIWVNMKQRCLNKKSTRYSNYGGRGISICDRWLNSFENFYEDMGELGKGLSLDRIDNNKGYYKENCQWSDKSQQANNKRNNVLITFKGETMSISQWERKLNINKGALDVRIRRGWSIERALTQKPRGFIKQRC